MELFEGDFKTRYVVEYFADKAPRLLVLLIISNKSFMLSKRLNNSVICLPPKAMGNITEFLAFKTSFIHCIQNGLQNGTEGLNFGFHELFCI